MQNHPRLRRTVRGPAVVVLAVVALLGVLGPGSASAAVPSADVPSADRGRVVRVGTEGTYPPFTYRDPRSNQLTGFDIEVIQAVAKKAGWKLDFVTSTFDAVFQRWTPSGSTWSPTR